MFWLVAQALLGGYSQAQVTSESYASLYDSFVSRLQPTFSRHVLIYFLHTMFAECICKM